MSGTHFFKHPVILIISLAFFILSAGVFRYYRAVHQVLPIKASFVLEIKPGESVITLASQLHEQGVLPSPSRLVWAARLTGKTRRLQAGEYAIEPGVTVMQLLDQMVAGQVIYRRFTIIAGWSFHQLRMALNSNPYLKHRLSALPDSEVMKQLGHPDASPEGQFYPETYTFRKGLSDAGLLEQAYQLMQAQLREEWEKRDKTVPYQTMYEALILASIVEKETGIDQERPLIARVILNRLKQGMRLQVDPTVIYALGWRFNGNLTRVNLQVDSPYNTYRYRGLPPTAIALPSAQSVEAALHPASGDYLYFVAKGDGTHAFSSGLQEHQQAVKRYQLNG